MNQARQSGNTPSCRVWVEHSLPSCFVDSAHGDTKLFFRSFCIRASRSSYDLFDQGFHPRFRCVVASLPLETLTMTFFF